MKLKSIALLALLPLVAGAAPKKMNVVFMIADDLNTAVTGYGRPDCKTPNLDRLAARGVVFENMHCQFPLCGPSRASLMTGRYPANVDILTLPTSPELRKRNPGIVTMSQLFKNQGYVAGRVSKIYHMGVPKDIVRGSDGSDDPESWDFAENVKSLEQGSPGEKVLLSPKNKGGQGFWSIRSEGGDLAQADGMATEKALAFLDKHQKEPFFLALGFVRPHVPLVSPKKYYDLFDPDQMTLPVVPGNDLDDVPAVARDFKTTEYYGITTQNHREILQAYYAAIAYVDAQVGRVLDRLDELGLADNTIIVFTSDHGYMLGEHFKWQKRHLFDESTQVPFIVSVPWMKEMQGQKTQKLTELIDLYPTLAELGKLECPAAVQGKSLVPLLRNVDAKEGGKEYAYTITNIGKGGESIRTQNWRYIRWKKGTGEAELYDCKNDPGQFTNLANNPEYAATVKELDAKLEYAATVKELDAKLKELKVLAGKQE